MARRQGRERHRVRGGRPVKLLIVRHGIAEERGPSWPDDRLRPLTRDGRLRMVRAGAGLSRLITPGVILSSPFTRAIETARALAEAWPGVPISLCDALAGGDHRSLLRAACGAGVPVVAAVGHEPHCSDAVLEFVFGGGAEGALAFKKGAAALLSFSGDARAGAAALDWFLPPRALRLLGG